MTFELAEDVRTELERLARLTRLDANHILRRLLEMPQTQREKTREEIKKALKEITDGSQTLIQPPKFYTTPRGDRLPHGKIVMRLHKKEILGQIDAKGININGKSFEMPSPAAKSVTGYDVNGWRAFRFEDAAGFRRPLEDFRGGR